VATESLRVGLVGCGRIAQTHLEALKEVRGCQLAGVSDVRGELARRAGGRYGVPAHDDPRRLLGEDLDAVIVCTPPSTHSEIATFFLDEGVHVLCEKPLALTSAEASVLIDTAERAGRLLMMASKFRFVEDVIRAREILDSGALGEVILYENAFCSWVDMGERWNALPALSGGGVLIDNGTHSVDVARFLLGPIVEVQATAGPRVQHLPVEDSCRLCFRTAAGSIGTVDLSWSIQKEREAYIEVFCARGVLSIGWRGSRYRLHDGDDWIPFGGGYDKPASFSRQLRNFCEVIRGNEMPAITAEDSLQSVRVIEAAYRAMAQGRWLPVAGTPTDGAPG
jgi:predicted dehydrogenase